MTRKKAFKFNAASSKRAKEIVARYPEGRQASAVMPLLDIAQRQNSGWLSREAMEYVARYLGMPIIRVYEVATFYTMYNLQPVGRHLVQVCTCTPCWLRGSDAVLEACRKSLGVDVGETSDDGFATLMEVECLGACVNAPMMQIDDEFFEDLDAKSTAELFEFLKRGDRPKSGPQAGRRSSEPAGGPTTLREISHLPKN